MDWDIGNGIATLVAFATGDASIYLSSGGGIIGGGEHERVNKAAKKLVASAARYFDGTAKTGSTPLPDEHCVRFYFLTGNGIFYAQDTMLNNENSSSPWLPFFEDANSVITELRVTTESEK